MQKLVAHYSALPREVLRTGLANFAAFPPDDQSFLTTRLWDIYMPGWREVRDAPKPDPDPMADEKLIAELEEMAKLPDAKSDHIAEINGLDYVKAEHRVYPRKGKWQRFSDEQEERFRKSKEGEPSMD